MRTYKEFLEEFNTPKYSERDMKVALQQQLEELEKRFIVNRVIKKGKDYDVAMRILSIHSTPEGRIIIVD